MDVNLSATARSIDPQDEEALTSTMDNHMSDSTTLPAAGNATPAATHPAVSGVDDALTAEILSAVPETAQPAPATESFVGPVLVPNASPPPASELAPVVADPGPPAILPPGGPAPARIVVGAVTADAAVTESLAVVPGPTSGPDEPWLVELQKLSDEQRRRILRKLTSDQERALNKDIDHLYARVTAELPNDKKRTQGALAILQQARKIMVESPENYVTAEYQVQRVEALLVSSANSRQWSAQYGRRVFAYEALWMFGFLLFYMLANIFWPMFSRWLIQVTGLDPNSVVVGQAVPFVSTLIWGGIGGAVGALYSLWYHISDQRDFDREFLVWYYTQPLLGMVLGGIVYLLFMTGMMVLQGGSATTDSLGARLLPSLIAAIGGFRQNFVFDQLARVIEAFSGSPKETPATATTTTSTTTTSTEIEVP